MASDPNSNNIEKIKSKSELLFVTILSKIVARKFFYLILFILCIVLLFLIKWFCIGGFFNYDAGRVAYIEKGMGAKEISSLLKSHNVYSGPSFLLTMSIVVSGLENKVVAGPYYFEKKEGIINVTRRIATGNYKISPYKLIVPEGFTVKQIGYRLKSNLPKFDYDAFDKLSKDKEGYLFPDTYYVMVDIKPEELMSIFSYNFDKKISSIKNSIINSGRKLEEIITMASIIEREVRGAEDKRIVSGIFWKRIEIGMPLQADSTLTYEIDKTSAELSLKDLRTDSPYNTYTKKGLPPTPISNPGLDSIIAAAEPKNSPYLYFLTDIEGNVHYAKTFEDHKLNKAKYIK